ncbi:SigE family RNA polymerase sigma factor [Glycomyces algeriensis]|uniref:RNA polymerase sigma24 factor n=1 Tax=Glycomyces algeriensis TaxID=256037 RepID=A0A9W6LGY6_9ACTN|nr:SigE family RNA polymerase sigma factor [Glycomyces algeriensis]MDA1364355.1 SigE family RNA polymerase sigma factor [Glycomyces algeriensis]MDR7350388.1 RNA polymerase sigma-70 factor (sigma-E family) [Glycomyces algeriensis]GLI43093.1 RNA polymerase sigma24 factor [Glycomyces algeriensis]
MKNRERHEAEFEAFALAQRESLQRFAYYLCGDWHEADDIVQKALTKLFTAWHRVELGGAPAYTRRIVTNVFFSHRRLAWVRREKTAETLPVQAVDRPQEEVDLRLTVLGALHLLSPRERATLVLRYWEQLSVAETAEAMGCSAGTVKSQTSRGLNKLRSALSETAVLTTTR